MALFTMVLAPETMGSVGRLHSSPKSIRNNRRVGHSVSFAPRCRVDLKYQVENSIYKCELEAAVEVVERACRLCTSVQEELKPNEGKSGPNLKFEKGDTSPVTVADLGVQALVSLELGHLFPSIPLVGEEDSRLLREDLTNFQKKTRFSQGQPLVEIVTKAVANVASTILQRVTAEAVLNALDRGVKSITETDGKKLSYWILDPIDGTRGFLRGGDALYVVGLALVVDGEVVLGVMGCPNVQFKYNSKSATGADFSLEMAMSRQSSQENTTESCEGVNAPVPRGFQCGLLMAASSGCGCWVRVLSRNAIVSDRKDTRHGCFKDMVESKVDGSTSTKDAIFCISDNENWISLPVAQALASIPAVEERLSEYEAQVLSLCCGSLCKYFAIALGGASVFVQHVQNAAQVKVWDHAAGVICVLEAGGQVTDFEGSPLQKMLGNGKISVSPRGGIVASNGGLHELLLTSLYSPVRCRSGNISVEGPLG